VQRADPGAAGQRQLALQPLGALPLLVVATVEKVDRVALAPATSRVGVLVQGG
jgi:hypothetical protein